MLPPSLCCCWFSLSHISAPPFCLWKRAGAAAGPKYVCPQCPQPRLLSQLSRGAGSRCKSLFHEQLHSPLVWGKALPGCGVQQEWPQLVPRETLEPREDPMPCRKIFLAGTVAMESPGRSSLKSWAWGRACTGALFPAACHRLILCAQCHDNNQWWQVTVGTMLPLVGTPVALGKSRRDILKFKFGAFSFYLILLNYLLTVFPSQRPAEPEQQQKMHKGLKVVLRFGYDVLRAVSALATFGLAC